MSNTIKVNRIVLILQERGTHIGMKVGYQIGGHKEVSSDCNIVAVTHGMKQYLSISLLNREVLNLIYQIPDFVELAYPIIFQVS